GASSVITPCTRPSYTLSKSTSRRSRRLQRRWCRASPLGRYPPNRRRVRPGSRVQLAHLWDRPAQRCRIPGRQQLNRATYRRFSAEMNLLLLRLRWAQKPHLLATGAPTPSFTLGLPGARASGRLPRDEATIIWSVADHRRYPGLIYTVTVRRSRVRRP